MAPAVTVLVRVSPGPEAVPQDSVEQKGRQLLTERTQATEPLGRPTVPVKGIMVTQPPRGGTLSLPTQAPGAEVFDLTAGELEEAERDFYG